MVGSRKSIEMKIEVLRLKDSGHSIKKIDAGLWLDLGWGLDWFE